MRTKVIGLGAGGHAKVVIEILRLAQEFDFAGLLDLDPQLQGREILGVRVLGSDALLPDLARQGVASFFVGLGCASNTAPRRRLYELALSHGLQPVNAIHPQAVVSPSSVLGSGVTVMAGVVINACVSVGVNGVINTGAILEHDCELGDHVYVATGARLTGGVRVGNLAHVGAGATIRQGIAIGEAAVVGAGAVVIKDVPPRTVVAGVPARELPPSPSRGHE